MTPEKIATSPRIPLEQVITGWADLPLIVQAQIESEANAEWHRGFHACEIAIAKGRGEEIPSAP